MSFMQLAGGLDLLPILHWAKVTNEFEIRDAGEPLRGWFECYQLRMLCLDLMRKLDGVALGDVGLFRVKPGDTVGFASLTDRTHRYIVALSCPEGMGVVGENKTAQLSPGGVWWLGQESAVLSNQGLGEEALILVIQIGLDS